VPRGVGNDRPVPERLGSITVVIAAHNASNTVGAAVASSLADGAVTECLVVDDASTDGTAQLVRRLADRDPRIEVVERSQRGGPARARNDGLARARGARVCFLDADDELLDGALRALEGAFTDSPGAVAAMGRFVAVDTGDEAVDVGRWTADQLHPVVRRHGRLIESPHGVTDEALVTRLISPPPGAWLVDVTTARAVGGFNPAARRSEDLELLVRLAECGEIACVERDVLRYLQHAAQRSAAHGRRRWGRGYTLWLMVRAAPGVRATIRLSGGMAAYHLSLFEARRSSAERHVRAMGLRNLLVAGVVRGAGVLAACLPRRLPPPIVGPPVGVVD
jgi:glycosyltransferase involved in cell wall biosynthesis